MKGIYTVEELGLGRTKEEHINAVVDSLISEDIVIFGSDKICSARILDSCSREFSRGLVNQILDSQNPVSSKFQEALKSEIIATATQIVSDIKQVF